MQAELGAEITLNSKAIMNQFWQRIVQLFWALALPVGALAGPITIGVDLGLTDRYPQIAMEMRQALLDHAQAINRAGGLLVGRPLRFEILDNRGVTDRSLEHLQALQAAASAGPGSITVQRLACGQPTR